MKRFFKNRGVRAAAIAVLAALIIGLGGTLLGSRGGLLSNALSSGLIPTGRGANAVLDSLEGVYAYLYEFDSLKAENEALKTRVAELENTVREGAAAIDENARLRELAGLTERRRDLELESARLSAWTASNWSSSFTLNKGSDSGVAAGDCVITASGAVVGQVSETGLGYCVVRTLIDTAGGLGAVVDGAEITGATVGDYELMRQGLLKFTYFDSQFAVLEGDTLLTSGAGGVVPAGLTVGRVLSVHADASGLSYYAVVEPAAELSAISQVFVVKSFDYSE